MGISFAESLKRAQYDLAIMEQAKQSRILLATNDEAVKATDTWQMVSDLGYKFYDEYSDENMSTVDDDKNIILHKKQINITQETNSQYIPFLMPRYYDGYDLANAKLQFYFVNKDGMYGIDYPVDVYCNNKELKFAWLVDQDVTMLDGKVEFEIQAIGINSKNEVYVWKTRPNSEINIIKSLEGSKFIEPDDSWRKDFVSRINTALINTKANKDLIDAHSARLDDLETKAGNNFAEITEAEINALFSFEA